MAMRAITNWKCDSGNYIIGINLRTGKLRSVVARMKSRVGIKRVMQSSNNFKIKLDMRTSLRPSVASQYQRLRNPLLKLT